MQLQEALRRVVEFLDDAAGSEDMASVQINNEGRCYYSIGMHWNRSPITIEEFAQIVKEGEKD